MKSPQAAWDILAREIAPLNPQRMPLEDAQGGYLAEPLAADRDIPPADRAAMDGFAVRAVDLSALPARLDVVGEVSAGSSDVPSIAPGHCVRIFTGANLPPDADTVVPVEQTSSRSFQDRPDDSRIEIAEAVAPGANIFLRGECARSGERLLDIGCRLGPRQIGIAAAAGHAHLAVHRRPRIRVLNTGAELQEACQPAASHQVRDSNGPFLLAALREAGFAEVSRARVSDSPDAIREAILRALAESDALILTGGISAGRYDHVPQALAASGAAILYRGVAMKPGKPQIFARNAAGQCFFGLPGNPLSSIVGFYELVLPALRRLQGCPIERCRPSLHLPLAETVRNAGDRLHLIPAVVEKGPGGACVRPRPPIGSADLVAGGRADGAILLPPGIGAFPAGRSVEFRPWGGLCA